MTFPETSDDALLKQALEMPVQTDEAKTAEPAQAPRDVSMMTEDEQIAYAMQLSLAAEAGAAKEESMEVDEEPAKPKTEEAQVRNLGKC